MTHAGPKTGRYLPPWIWVVITLVGAVAVFSALGGIISVLLPHGTVSTAADSRDSRSLAAPTSTPSMTPAVTPSPAAVALSVPSQGASIGGSSTLSAGDVSTIEAAVAAHDTGAIQVYLGATVGVVMPTRGQNGIESSATALDDLSSVFTSAATWSFTPDPTTLTKYRQGSFGKYFPTKAIVGTSRDGHVVSLIPSGQGLVTLLIAPDDTLLLSN